MFKFVKNKTNTDQTFKTFMEFLFIYYCKHFDIAFWFYIINTNHHWFNKSKKYK